MLGVFGHAPKPQVYVPSLLFNEAITAGFDAGPPEYVGYGQGFIGSITGTAISIGNVTGVVDDNTNGFFMIIINTPSDPGYDYLTDVQVDDVSIMGDFQGYDYESLGTDLAVWYFTTRSLVSTTVYDVKLYG